MNKKFLLTLLSSSTIFTSLMSTLTVVHPAYAAATMTQRLVHTNDGRTCITHPHGNTSFVCIRDSERKLGAPLYLHRQLSQRSHLIARLLY